MTTQRTNVRPDVAVIDEESETASRGVLVSSGTDVDVPRSSVVALVDEEGESASRDVFEVSNIEMTTSQTTVVTVASLSTVNTTETLLLNRQFTEPLLSAVAGHQSLNTAEDVSDMPLKVHASPALSIEEDINF